MNKVLAVLLITITTLLLSSCTKEEILSLTCNSEEYTYKYYFNDKGVLIKGNVLGYDFTDIEITDYNNSDNHDSFDVNNAYEYILKIHESNEAMTCITN